MMVAACQILHSLAVLAHMLNTRGLFVDALAHIGDAFHSKLTIEIKKAQEKAIPTLV